MSETKKFLTIIGDDKELLAMFSGISLISCAVTACVWYL